MLTNENPQYLLQKSIVLLTVIVFAFYLLFDLGLLNLIFESDKSKISILILFIYTAATIHWLFLAWRLDGEQKGDGNVSDFINVSNSKRSLKDKTF